MQGPPTIQRARKRRRRQQDPPSAMALLGSDQEQWTAASLVLSLDGEAPSERLIVAVAGARPVSLRQSRVDPRIFTSDELFAKELVTPDDVSKERATELTLSTVAVPEVVPFTVTSTKSGRAFTVMQRLPMLGGDEASRTSAAYRSMVDQLAQMFDQGVYYFDLKLGNLLCQGTGDLPEVRITDVAEVMTESRLLMLAYNVMCGDAKDWLHRRLRTVPAVADLELLCQGWGGTLATFVPSNICQLMSQHQPRLDRLVCFDMAEGGGALVSYLPGSSVERAESAVPAMRGVWALLTCWAAMTVALELAGYAWKRFVKWPLAAGPCPVLELGPPDQPGPPGELAELVECAVAAYQSCQRLMVDPQLENHPDIDLLDLLEPGPLSPVPCPDE